MEPYIIAFVFISFLFGVLLGYILEPHRSINLEECQEFDPEVHGLDFNETSIILETLYNRRARYPNTENKEINKLIHKMIERRNIIELEELKQHPEWGRQC